MGSVKLGRTGLAVEKQGFGCLPIQRISKAEAVELLHRAYDGGVNYFDTARAYSDSEEKVGAAFAGMWDRVILATKTAAQTAEEFWKDLETSLCTLGTDHIDIYQFHNPAFCPRPGGADGLYDAALEAKRQGKIRHISITNHRLAVAHEAIDSGLYDTLQFPFSYLSGPQELELVEKCRAADMGFIAMKGLAGGLIRDGLTVPVRGERTACMMPPWRPSARERSATSPLPITAWRWPMRPSTPGCMTPCNSPSATCPAPRSWNWWRNAGRRIWALLP